MAKSYNCPYHSDYTDLIFKACTAATPSNTFTIPAGPTTSSGTTSYS